MTDFKDRISGLSPKRLALLAVELQKKVERAESRRAEPVAVVGVGCRFPGRAHGPEAFWRILRDGVDCIGEVPADRWDADAYYDADPKAPGKMNTRSGGFIDEIDRFDAAFFGITPREAASLDPRYRLLLEVAWEALENAGQAPDGLLGSQTGVFVGACGSDYNQLLIEGQPDTLDAYLVSGSATSMAAGRISYALGLQGPSLTVDTACSSSLVAVHLACQSLRADECAMAIAAGTSLILAPEVSIGLSSAEMLSPEGRCKTFDAAADGIGRGEGCGAIVLKRLSDAEADGDTVLAVIRGTAINQDGRSGGITAPNGPSQEAVIREALRRSGVEPADIGYVEAHGTGTTLGDPIEVRALDAVFGASRNAGRPLRIGSVKTNFGHLEASAGIASLVKVVLSLVHETIPPHLHLARPNPHIAWDEMCVTIPTELTSWPRGGARRVAGVSSFGFSGSNAHVVVEEAPAAASPAAVDDDDGSAQVLTLSARTAPALDALLARYLEVLVADRSWPMADVCFTANAGRARFEERIAVVGESPQEISEGLEALLRNRSGSNVFRGRATSSKSPAVVFVFPDHTDGPPDRGRRLYESVPVLRKNIDRCAEILQPVLGDEIRSILCAADGRSPDAADARCARAATFAWQYALAEMWRAWGVAPAVALGYGVGEIAAACVAGVFSLEDALALVVGHASPTASADGDRQEALAGWRFGTPAFGLIDAATGRLAAPEEITSAEHWCRNDRAPTDIRTAMKGLEDAGYRLFLEVAPAPVLLPEASGIIESGDTEWLPSLHDDHAQVARSVAALYVHGVNIDWRSFYQGRERRIVSLPTYPFERKRHWVASVRERAVPGEREPWRDWLYEFSWRGLDRRAGDARDLRAPDAIAEIVSGHVESLAEQNGIGIYRKFEPRFDALCSAYILQALGELGWQPGDDSAPFTAASLQEHLGVLPVHGRLFGRMLDILAEDGVLRPKGDGAWVCAGLPDPIDIAALEDELQSQYPDCAAELDLTIGCGRSLGTVLSGETDPMQLLFPGGSLAKTERLYQESAGLRMFNSLVREAVAAASAAVGPDRKLRILELGAGTGAATSYILPVLRPEQTEYVFTDVSKAFLGAAHEKFRDYGFLEYRLFDAGSSPAEQGFREGEFDIVIAANVIHATPDLRTTLGNIREVLAPNGLVVLLEGTVPQRFGDLTVGLTPGWWSFTDVDLRPSYALLTAPQWKDLFIDCGFASVAAVPDGNHALGGAVNQQSVLVARAPDAGTVEPDRGDWLVFCDDDGTGEALVAGIRAAGGRCVAVRKGDAFEATAEDSYALDAAAPEHYARLMKAVLHERASSLRGIVHCWSLDEALPADADLAALERAETLACGSALFLTQAVASAASGRPPRLFLLTRQSQAVVANEPCPGFAQAANWGLARVIELEHAELRCVAVDLDDAPPEAAAGDLLERVLFADSEENQLAFRDGRLLALRAMSAAGGASRSTANAGVSGDAAYVVTGGLSGLGLLVAEWLVSQGARHLVLVGRRPPGDEAGRSLTAMRSTGATIQAVQGDIATPECVAGIESAVRASEVPLRGIVHCAGAIDDGALLQQDWDRFRSVMAAKVRGSWNLHRLSEAWPLDFFVLFSTGAAFLGSPGQSNHAAANAFMDALAHYRRARGLSALTVNWGPWSETGAAVRTGVADFAVASGMGTISPRQGLAILDELLRDGTVTQVAVLPAKPAQLLATHQTGRPIPVFEELEQATARGTAADEAGAELLVAQEELLATLENASPKTRRNLLLRQIQQATVKVMGLGDGEMIDPRRPLIDLGLDSLMAVELRNAVNRLVGRSLPATLLFNYPSISELVDHLLDDVLELTDRDERDGRDKEAAKEQEARDQELDQLGEDEIAERLASRLTDLDHAS